MQTGVARKPIDDIGAYRRDLSARLDPTASFLQDVFARITPEQKRVVFTEGEELVRVESLDYETAVSRAEAALLRAEAELEHSKFELMRMRSLEERKLASRSNLENALRMYRVNTAAQLDAAANLKQAQENLKRTTLFAPFTGLVRAKSVDIGQFVSRGQPIATVYANSSVEVRLPVADRQLAFLNIPPTQRGELPLESQPSVCLLYTSPSPRD